jgi:polysaccharide export outer membrane protein
MEATKIFNAANLPVVESSRAASGVVQASGYLVDQEGFIDFPVLGKVKAAGATKKELKQRITSDLVSRKLLIEPIVDIRYLNFRVTVLGEVGSPSVVNVPHEKITLLEALGLAGDLTVYGKRDNVLIVRDEGGRKLLTRINLNSAELFQSPYYYLQSNDVVYVEPNKAKISATGQARNWLPIVLSAISVTVIAVDRITR